jgi:hypothetical protein
MKNYIILALVIFVLILAGVIFFGRQKPIIVTPENLPTTTTSVKSGQPSDHGVPRVITLYHAGEKESLRAVAVANRLEAGEENLAIFRSYDTLDEPQMAVLYGVNSVPAIIFLTPSGKVSKKHEGYLSQAEIIRIIRSIGEKN